jgi:hypothetical protein
LKPQIARHNPTLSVLDLTGPSNYPVFTRTVPSLHDYVIPFALRALNRGVSIYVAHYLFWSMLDAVVIPTTRPSLALEREVIRVDSTLGAWGRYRVEHSHLGFLPLDILLGIPKRKLSPHDFDATRRAGWDAVDREAPTTASGVIRHEQVVAPVVTNSLGYLDVD